MRRRRLAHSESTGDPAARIRQPRENWTEPRHVRDIAGKLAEIKGVAPADVEAVTTANFLNMLGEKGRAAAESTAKSKSPSTGSG